MSKNVNNDVSKDSPIAVVKSFLVNRGGLDEQIARRVRYLSLQ